MNLGAALVLLKLAQEIGMPGEAPKAVVGKIYDVPPNCPPGYYAYQHPRTGKYTCKPIPKGR